MTCSKITYITEVIFKPQCRREISLQTESVWSFNNRIHFSVQYSLQQILVSRRSFFVSLVYSDYSLVIQ